MFEQVDAAFQKMLVSARWIILVVVVSGIVSSVLMVIIGTFEVFQSARETVRLLMGTVANPEGTTNLIMSEVIRSIDAYLIATVLLLFSVGLYELFINKISSFDHTHVSGNILVIKSLDQLKEKLGKLIIMILIVSFFERAINLHITDALSLLYIGLSIMFIAIAIFLTHSKQFFSGYFRKQIVSLYPYSG